MGKKSTYDYELIVIGSGAGGSVAAHLAKKAGFSVAIVEADTIGGECPNIGCVPTKALLQAAEVYEAAKHGEKFGIRGTTVGYNYPSVKAWKDLAVKRTGTYLGEAVFSKEGISVIHGRAHFLDPHTISVGVARFSAKHFLIATGSKVFIPSIPGLHQTGFITFKEAIDLTRPPRSLAILGGGAIGCEFAQLFAIFGTKVHIIDVSEQLLPKEEPEVSEFLKERFSDEYSMSLHLGVHVEKIETFGGKKRLVLKKGKKSALLAVDEILVATGKRGNVDLGLENAGVAYENSKIVVNQYMQTTAAHIFAAGDCVGPYLYTHMSTYQSRVAANNMLHPKKLVAADYRAVPRCIYTNPEIASVGKTEAELSTERQAFKVVVVPVSVVGRANTTDTSGGFIKVLAAKRSNVILGATVVCPHAGEVIHELTVAVQNNLTTSQIADTIHAFPTWSEVVRVACSKLSRMK